MFMIDGLVWNVPCNIEREARISASDISGLMLDRSYFNDVLGTYMEYTIGIAVPMNMRQQYKQIYEALTNPLDGHKFILPYNDNIISLTARVTNVSDVYVRLPGGENYWKGIEFTILSNYPTKAMSLGEMVVTGREPFPPVHAPAEGAKYEYHLGNWVPGIDYTDADHNTY